MCEEIIHWNIKLCESEIWLGPWGSQLGLSRLRGTTGDMNEVNRPKAKLTGHLGAGDTELGEHRWLATSPPYDDS